MADIKEAIRRLIYEYTSKGADEVMATQEAVAASTTKTDKASLSLEKSFSSLERRYVETVRAQQDYAKVQDRVNAAVAQNPALQERANVVLSQAKQHFENMATGASKADMAATVLIRTMSRTLGPLALVGVAVAGISSAMEFMEPIAVRVGTDIYRRFSEAYPAAAGLSDGILKVAKAFYETERASAKIEAINAAWKGVASSAELAALKIETANQKFVNQRGAAEMAQAQERIANHVRELLQLYPGVTIETAKQLELSDAQLAVAQARTEEEKRIAEEKLRQVELTQQGVKAEEQQLIIARDRAKAEAGEAKARQDNVYYSQNATAATNEAYKAQARVTQAVNDTTQAYGSLNSAMAKGDNHVKNTTKSIVEMGLSAITLAEAIEGRLDMLDAQFKSGTGYTSGAGGTNPLGFAMNPFQATNTQLSAYDQAIQAAMASGQGIDTGAYIAGQDISTPAAASQSLANIIALGLQGGLSNVNRLIDAVTDKGTQASLIAQAIAAVQATVQPGLAREEMINELNSKLEQLANSTDSLNSTMQNALSPFYSQDPRTTHLGFRAGVVGNPEWQVGGASNTNPLAALLGAGATAPGMAGGGSFVVGGGYSANDNRIAAFPVASGEEVIVNRNRADSQRGQVIHIDNRTIINGRVDADVFAQMKVSKFQQAQRMRAGLAAA